MEKSERLAVACLAISSIYYSADNPRESVEYHIRHDDISPDDPWVAACLNCVEDSDIPDIALEFFVADIKSGFYDLAG